MTIFVAILRLLTLFAAVYAVNTGTWINLGIRDYTQLKFAYSPKTHNTTAAKICASLKGLSQGQAKLCQLSVDHMPSVTMGMQHAIEECQHQFKNRRWNCSAAVLGSTLQIGSRETAFVHALTTAGVVYGISRSCREGLLSSCGCSKINKPLNVKRDWTWNGCGDNVEYGYKFTQSFIDVRERERSYKRGNREKGKSLMNMHNNEAGRRAVVEKSKVTCKCHGVSGSCTMITCWQQLASFREIGNHLMKKYDHATEVKFNRRTGHLVIRDPNYTIPTANHLIYLDLSPNYCVENKTLGSLGTQGRLCNKTSTDIDGCNLLCCGRGYNTQKASKLVKCDCKFRWCCNVECKTCIKYYDVYTCK